METYSELIYISTASDYIASQDVKSILESSRANNLRKNVTGLLCYDGSRFLQIIEGPKQNVKDIYYKIAQDNRHDFIEIIHFDDIEQRTFNRWQMAFKKIPNNLLIALSDKSLLLNFSEARGALNNTDFSFGAALFSIIMDSAYGSKKSENTDDDQIWDEISFSA